MAIVLAVEKQLILPSFAIIVKPVIAQDVISRVFTLLNGGLEIIGRIGGDMNEKNK